MRHERRPPSRFTFSRGATLGLGDDLGGSADGRLDRILVQFERGGQSLEHHLGGRRIEIAVADAIDPPNALGDVFEPTPPRRARRGACRAVSVGSR